MSGIVWQVAARKNIVITFGHQPYIVPCGFLNRLKLLTDGASEAAKRRDMALNLERRAVRERCAQAASLQ